MGIESKFLQAFPCENPHLLHAFNRQFANFCAAAGCNGLYFKRQARAAAFGHSTT